MDFIYTTKAIPKCDNLYDSILSFPALLFLILISVVALLGRFVYETNKYNEDKSERQKEGDLEAFFASLFIALLLLFGGVPLSWYNFAKIKVALSDKSPENTVVVGEVSSYYHSTGKSRRVTAFYKVDGATTSVEDGPFPLKAIFYKNSSEFSVCR